MTEPEIKSFTIEEACHFIRKQGEEFFGTDRAKELITAFDDLRLPTKSEETRQCNAILAMFTDYLQRDSVSRPFSIAVFGPPGSGKSVTVKKLATEAVKAIEKSKGSNASKVKIEGPEVINLSQFNSPLELMKALLGLFSLTKPDVTRLVFFDEFDSELERTKLGWLKLFLAPMQDGVFSYDGKPIAIGKAIFVFAGGTAESFKEFNRHGERDFIDAKGPDFVSRLRGFINIQGLNKHDEERIIRRSLVLYYQLSKRSKTLVASDKGINIEEPLLRQILLGTHYIHESRSMEALLDMCILTEKSRFDDSHLKHLTTSNQLSLHVSRGTLDGVTVGVAAGQDESTQFFLDLAKQLFCRGANLAHGGDLFQGAPLQTMIDEFTNAPEELVKRESTERRVTNYLAFPSYWNPDFLRERTNKEKIVKFVKLPDMSASEVKHWGFPNPVLVKFEKLVNGYFRATKDETKTKKKAKEESPFEKEESPFEPVRHLAWGIGLFRMRLRLIQDTQALIVIGGKTEGGWGRFPGVAEEVMLAIAHKRPLYILGDAAKGKPPKGGEASRSIGRYLGLDQTQQSDPMFEHPVSPTPDYFRQHDWYFQVPSHPNLPRDLTELRSYFRAHGIESQKWIDNGLTLAENRELFQKKEIKECVELIIKGLTKLYSPRKPVRSGGHAPS